jgi:predicted amidohydrolase
VHFRYRKFHLFGEPGFSTTQEPEFSTFDTDFGVKFGMFTCFDILFEEPAVSLVKVLGVTDVVFPTAWFPELLFLSRNVG